MEKRGQVTIFIIIAVVIVAAVVLFFVFRSGAVPGIPGFGKDVNPETFLDECIEPEVREAVDMLSLRGGDLDSSLYKTFKFEAEGEFRNITYLCYNQNYYQACINQQPMLMSHLSDELKEYISNDVEVCFDELVSGLEKQGNEVIVNNANELEVDLLPGKIKVELDRKITLTKNNVAEEQESFEIIIPSKFYDLASVAHEIVNQETSFCNFDYLGFMAFYPEFEITKFKTGDSTTIYTVENKKTKERFRFAVRGCVIPPGL
ncbi:hypothetical protein ACFL0X_00720 [Nanoarchaeota archaeon]